MIIAVNTRILPGNTHSNYFIEKCFSRIVIDQPNHQFIFIESGSPSTQVPDAANVKKIRIASASGNTLMWKYWFNYKLAAAVRKYGADALVHADMVCSMRTRVPQFVFVNDVLTTHQQAAWSKKYAGFIQSNVYAYLKKAAAIIASSQATALALSTKYKLHPEKIHTVYPGAGTNFQPLSFEEKQSVKEKYAASKEYFLFSGPVHEGSNLINLLKAFSIFKQRQKSNMKLLLLTKKIPAGNSFAGSIRLYKYRHDVQLLEDVPQHELKRIVASAYTFVSPLLYAGEYENIFNAMQCGVPVIASDNESNKELLGEAVLFIDPKNTADIADKMMLLFKNENEAAALIQKAAVQVKNYDGDTSARLLWQHIVSATN